jgi:hypothetical protein
MITGSPWSGALFGALMVFLMVSGESSRKDDTTNENNNR